MINALFAFDDPSLARAAADRLTAAGLPRGALRLHAPDRTPSWPDEVSTPVFEGPFDLLLHLILKEEVDLWEISLAHIVDVFCVEVEKMEHVDLDVATEFLLIAATLAYGAPAVGALAGRKRFTTATRPSRAVHAG